MGVHSGGPLAPYRPVRGFATIPSCASTQTKRYGRGGISQHHDGTFAFIGARCVRSRSSRSDAYQGITLPGIVVQPLDAEFGKCDLHVVVRRERVEGHDAVE